MVEGDSSYYTPTKPETYRQMVRTDTNPGLSYGANNTGGASRSQEVDPSKSTFKERLGSAGLRKKNPLRSAESEFNKANRKMTEWKRDNEEREAGKRKFFKQKNWREVQERLDRARVALSKAMMDNQSTDNIGEGLMQEQDTPGQGQIFASNELEDTDTGRR